MGQWVGLAVSSCDVLTSMGCVMTQTDSTRGKMRSDVSILSEVEGVRASFERRIYLRNGRTAMGSGGFAHQKMVGLT